MEDEEIDYYDEYHQLKCRRRLRRVITRFKNQKLMHDTWFYPNSYCIGPYMFEGDKGNYIKRSSSKRKKLYKKCSTKVIRNSKDDFSTNEKCHYRKRFDLQWNID